VQVRSNAAAGYSTTALTGDDTRYYGRVAYTGTRPTSVSLVNASDVPPTVKTVPVVDVVSVSRSDYDADAKTLTVAATSTETAAGTTLTVTGFGPLVAGTATFSNVTAPPPAVTVVSSAGGRTSSSLRASGAAFAPVPVAAFAGADQTVQQSQAVTLDGTASTGEITGYSWTQTSGTPVTLTGASTPQPSFSAPDAAGVLTFQLTVSGPGGPVSDTVDVTVAAVAAPVANAGPDQAAARGSSVTLSGSASTGAAAYSWTQTAGPAVTLTGATTATPRFTVPQAGGPFTFTLSVTGPGGTASDSVTVTPINDTLTVTTARYRTGSKLWRITGNATVLTGSNTVTIHLGGTLAGPVLGTATVNATTGVWDYKSTNNVLPDASQRISLESSAGGRLLGVVLSVTA
jgi:hypothetical protein